MLKRPGAEEPITDFHSLGSRSVWVSWWSWLSLGTRMGILDLVGRRVGVNGATIIRGDMGGELGGVVVEEEDDDDDIMGVVDGQEADKGLQESLRRQLG